MKAEARLEEASLNPMRKWRLILREGEQAIALLRRVKDSEPCHTGLFVTPELESEIGEYLEGGDE